MFGNCFHYTSLKYFNLFVGPIPVLSVKPFCYFKRVSLPFTPSTEYLSHHSLPLLLAPKKSKLKKLKQRAKHRKQAPASKLWRPSHVKPTRWRSASRATSISTRSPNNADLHLTGSKQCRSLPH